MPAWTPETEGFAPFDDEDEIKADLPPELAQFIQTFSIGKQFTIEIKKWKNENYSGRPALVSRMEGMVPDYNSVVRLNGPGYYGFDTTWIPKGGKVRTEMLKVALVGHEWENMYRQAEKDRQKEELAEAQHEAELARVRNGGNPLLGTYKDPAATGREYMKSMLGDMKDLADTFGMGMKPAGGMGGEQNTMGMMFMGMMQMMMKQSENSTNLLIAVMGNKDKGNDMKEIFGTFREMIGIRDSLMPKDRSWIEEIVGAVAANLDGIAGLFMRGNPENDPLHQKMNEGLAETRERVHEDPAFLQGLVKHMDKKVGPKMTEKILNGFLNINRPAPSGPGAPTAPSPEAKEAAGDTGEAD